jgi:hypothetical protein
MRCTVLTSTECPILQRAPAGSQSHQRHYCRVAAAAAVVAVVAVVDDVVVVAAADAAAVAAVVAADDADADDAGVVHSANAVPAAVRTTAG